MYYSGIHSNLAYICFPNQNDVVKLLLENEADVNIATPDNWTPVHDAARNGHVTVLRTLASANADMQVYNV